MISNAIKMLLTEDEDTGSSATPASVGKAWPLFRFGLLRCAHIDKCTCEDASDIKVQDMYKAKLNRKIHAAKKKAGQF